MTIGQERIGVDFNPSKSLDVDQIKEKSAELIDFLESLKTPERSEKNRLLNIAQTNIETASMYAVKANFK